LARHSSVSPVNSDLWPGNRSVGTVPASTQDTLSAIDDGNTVPLDVRDVDEWIGDSSSPYGKEFCPRKGCIPGARWLEWYRMMKPTAAGVMFKSPDELRAECATVEITPDTPVLI
jgi:thiosulfate/3-mercaptopyruvate sulfurtransferase